MSHHRGSCSSMDVTELEEFLRDPSPGFTVEACGSSYRLVKSDPESCCIFIDDVETSTGKVSFQNSSGRKIKVHNLRDYTNVRKSLTTKRTFVLVSACQERAESEKKLAEASKGKKALKWFVVCLNGGHPLIRWQMEKGLDWAISSVAGESYSLCVDLRKVLESWEAYTFGSSGRHVWLHTSFTLKYCSDALFDFPYWLGFSKRTFKFTYYR